MDIWKYYALTEQDLLKNQKKGETNVFNHNFSLIYKHNIEWFYAYNGKRVDNKNDADSIYIEIPSHSPFFWKMPLENCFDYSHKDNEIMDKIPKRYHSSIRRADKIKYEHEDEYVVWFINNKMVHSSSLNGLINEIKNIEDKNGGYDYGYMENKL